MEGWWENGRVLFYGLYSFWYLLWFYLLKKTTRLSPSALCSSSALSCPPFLSSSTLLSLHSHKPFIFSSLPHLFFLASLFSFLEWWTEDNPFIHLLAPFIRFLASLFFVLYHLIETSVTNRHGEYPLLYSSIFFGLPLPSTLPNPFSPSSPFSTSLLPLSLLYGFTIQFIFLTGVGKVKVGGKDWFFSSTLSSYLSMYSRSTTNPPLSPSLSHILIQSPVLSSLLSSVTLLCEILFIPLLGLALPPGQRWVTMVLMIGLHLGIILFMSKKVHFSFSLLYPFFSFLCLSCCIQQCQIYYRLIHISYIAPIQKSNSNS